MGRGRRGRGRRGEASQGCVVREGGVERGEREKEGLGREENKSNGISPQLMDPPIM